MKGSIISALTLLGIVLLAGNTAFRRTHKRTALTIEHIFNREGMGFIWDCTDDAVKETILVGTVELIEDHYG